MSKATRLDAEQPTDLDWVEEQQVEQARLEAHEDERFAEDLKWLLAHKPGRRMVWWWLSQAGVFRNPWRPSASEHSYLSGAMSMGQMLLQRVMAIAPDAFTTMMKEAHDDAKRRSNRSS